MENYIFYEEINQTRLAKVYKAKNKKTKEIVALKIITEKKVEEAPSKETLRELLVLMNFEHQHIVSFRNVFVNKNSIVLEQEYCTCDLSQVIKTISKPFTLNQIRKIISSVAEGLLFLHENDIIHRDIKPSNILIDENCIVKLCDFGSSRIYIPNKLFTSGIGTKWYKAPEILLGKKNYNKQIDVWSLGCILAELFLLEPLFPGSSDFEMINLVFDKLGYSNDDDEAIKPEFSLLIHEGNNDLEEILDQCNKEALDLIKKMLTVNPLTRISLQDILEHPFLKIKDPNNNYLSCQLPI